MKKLDDRGFTLIELIVTIIILGLVLSIGGYSIIRVMNRAKESDYKLLIENIKAAAEVYYQECKYSKSEESVCVMVGDVNMDGSIDVFDANEIHININGGYSYDNIYDKVLADADVDGDVDSDDVVMVSNYIVGLDSSRFIGTFPNKSKVSLGFLVKYGYLKGNVTGDDLGIVNPSISEGDADISECEIGITYEDGKVKVVAAVNPTDSCPTEY